MARENLIGVAGFAYGATRFTSDDLLFPGGTETSDDRDNDSYYFTVGADSQFSQRLSGSLRVGVQYTDYEDDSSVSPYPDLSSTYTYRPNCYLRGGVRHFRNTTDEAGGPNDVTLDQESTGLYAEINHKLTPQLNANMLVQYQNSEFNEGALDGDADNYFLAHMGLDYEINQFLSTGLGYDFSRLDSDISNRSFTRNVVYVGIRASY
jgi:hypothetical protein